MRASGFNIDTSSFVLFESAGLSAKVLSSPRHGSYMLGYMAGLSMKVPTL